MTHTFTTTAFTPSGDEQEVVITYTYHREWGDQPAWIDIQKVTPNDKWDEDWLMRECLADYERYPVSYKAVDRLDG